MTERDIVVRLRFNARTALAAFTLFFLCWRPAPLNSETLTLTTYYPAPYGGYVSLLTTQNTTLARDAGYTLGVGTVPNPSFTVNGSPYTAKLHLNGHLKTPAGFIMYSAGDQYTAGSGALYVNNALGLRVTNAAAGSGDIYLTGKLYGVCETKTYDTTSSQNCQPGATIVGAFGTNATLPTGSSTLSARVTASDGASGIYVNVANDWVGTFVCCKYSAGSPSP